MQLLLLPATMAAILFQGLIWLQPLGVWAAVWEHFAVQLAGLSFVAALLALALRRWIWGALLIALTTTHAWPVLDTLGGSEADLRPERLRIVSANLYYYASDQAATLRFLRDSGADVVGLVEVTPAWRQAIESLADLYPYRVDCFDVETDCENALFSKLPLSNPRIGRLAADAPIILSADVQWAGRPLTIVATHVSWPLSPAMNAPRGLVFRADQAPVLSESLPATWQAEQMEALARILAGLPNDLVLMGDMNSAPWSRAQGALRRAAGLENAAGWRLTWPAWMWSFLRLPIDHILTRGDLVVASFAAGPRTESDHLPIIAEIGWRR